MACCCPLPHGRLSCKVSWLWEIPPEVAAQLVAVVCLRRAHTRTLPMQIQAQHSSSSSFPRPPESCPRRRICGNLSLIGPDWAAATPIVTPAASRERCIQHRLASAFQLEAPAPHKVSPLPGWRHGQIDTRGSSPRPRVRPWTRTRSFPLFLGAKPRHSARVTVPMGALSMYEYASSCIHPFSLLHFLLPSPPSLLSTRRCRALGGSLRLIRQAWASGRRNCITTCRLCIRHV
jgi:hypothetical protein